MKKIILIFFLFVRMILAQGGVEQIILMGDDAGYDNAETTLYASALTTALSDSQMMNIDEFVSMVKDSFSISLLSEKFDVMYLLGNETSEAALLNLVERDNDATAQGSPTFTAWQGFTAASGKYLNTTFNPNDEGVNYTLNSGSFGVYIRNNTLSAGIDMGGRASEISEDQIWLTVRYTGNKFYAECNSATLIENANLDSRGLFVISRTAADLTAVYQNGRSLSPSVAVAISIFDGFIFIGSLNEGGSPVSPTDRQYAFAFMGAGLTATEVRKLNNCIEWYMDDLGTGVE